MNLKSTPIFFLTAVLSCINTVQAQSPTPMLRGRVIAEQTGRPLQLSQVIVIGANLFALTDSLGRFEFMEIPSGYQKILIKNFGYEDYMVDPILFDRNSTEELEVELVQNVQDAGVVRVTARSLRRNEVPPIGVKKLNIEQIERAPGGNRDIAKVVQNLPGVAPTPQGRNDLIVRGGGPNENSFFVDRIEIPILNHFQTQGATGGNVSIVNSDLLSGATLYTSAFPANRGGALSSVLELTMKEGNSDRFQTRLAVGASDFSATIDTPLGEKSSLIASYRISYLQFLFAALDLPILPTYQDLQFKYVFKPNDKNKLKILGFGALDNNDLNLEMENLDPSAQQLLNFLPENDQFSYVLGAVYTRLLDNGSLDVVLSHNRLNNKLDKWLDNNKESLQTLDYASNETEIKSRVEYNGRLGGGYTLNAGVGVEAGWYDNSTSQIIFLGQDTIPTLYTSELNVYRYSLFGSVNKRFFDDNLRLMASLRLDGNSYNSKTANPLRQLSPRLSVSWIFAPKWSLNGNVGRYYQEPSYTTMGYRDSLGVLVNKDRVEYIGSNQYTLGVAFAPSVSQRLAVELFLKHYDHYPMSLVDSTAIGSAGADVFAVGAEPVASVGELRAWGVEVSYQNEDLWGFNLFTTYTYYHSEYAKLDAEFKPTSEFIPTNWDYTHLFNFLLSRKFGKNWEVGLRWRFAGGGPYTPYDVDLSSQIDTWETNGRPVLDYSLNNTQRLPAFHQLDLRVDKNWYFKKWSFGIYLDIQNLYNYSAYGQDILLPEVDLNGQYVEDPDKPGYYKMVEYPNSIGGSIIPTFGVMIEF